MTHSWLRWERPASPIRTRHERSRPPNGLCQQVNNGTQTVDVVKQVQSSNSGLQEDGAAKFTAIAANAYCPAILSGHGANPPG
ncbi:DUF732 domain-containing protein [Mycobacterium ulcerans]|uniref:DUF732 domain-containing protein n=1 Tax=Mycobacterium ulcerans TaxID=1809 RepID=UPI002AB24BE7|nr:DUF732 domain-containing protein [Mycobacterium ulcerans]